MSALLDIRAVGACRTPDRDYGYDLHWPATESPYFAEQIARAKTVCAGCPVLAKCQLHALTAPEPYGIWGGLTESERRAVWQRQREQELAAAAAETDAAPAAAEAVA